MIVSILRSVMPSTVSAVAPAVMAPAVMAPAVMAPAVMAPAVMAPAFAESLEEASRYRWGVSRCR